MTIQTLSSIKRIIIHCSATPPNADIGADVIRTWHQREKGWPDIGYHFVIRRDGRIEYGRHITDVGAHVAGKNTGSIGICLIGGITKQGKPENNFTPEQFRALSMKLDELLELLPGRVTIHGHNEFANKACPSFDVRKWLDVGG